MFNEDIFDEMMIASFKEQLFYSCEERERFGDCDTEVFDALRIMIEYYGQPGKDYFYETDT